MLSAAAAESGRRYSAARRRTLVKTLKLTGRKRRGDKKILGMAFVGCYNNNRRGRISTPERGNPLIVKFGLEQLLYLNF